MAIDIVRNTENRHKKDHYPDGAFFEQTAYGISRQPSKKGINRLRYRKPLVELIDNKGNVNKTRRALESIESEVTRYTILESFDKRIAEGAPLKQIFDLPILHPQFQTPITRVRLLGYSVDVSCDLIRLSDGGISELRQLRELRQHGSDEVFGLWLSRFIVFCVRRRRLTPNISKNSFQKVCASARSADSSCQSWAKRRALSLISLGDNGIYSDFPRKLGEIYHSVAGW